MNCIEKYVGGVGARVCCMTAAVVDKDFADATGVSGAGRIGRAITLPLAVTCAPISAPIVGAGDMHEVIDATCRIGGKQVEAELPWYAKPTTHKVVGAVTLAVVVGGIVAGTAAIIKHNSDD